MKSDERMIQIDNLSIIPFALTAIAVMHSEEFALKIFKDPHYYYTILYSSMEAKTDLCCAKGLIKGLCKYRPQHLKKLEENIQKVCICLLFLLKTGVN